jgi:hypothetical protein
MCRVLLLKDPESLSKRLAAMNILAEAVGRPHDEFLVGSVS